MIKYPEEQQKRLDALIGDHLLTVRDVAIILRADENGIMRRVKKGELPLMPIKISRKYYFKASQVKKWFDSLI